MKVRRQEQEIEKLERILSHKFSQTRRDSQPLEQQYTQEIYIYIIHI